MSLSRFTLLFVLLTLALGIVFLMIRIFAGPSVLIPNFWVVFAFVAGLTFLAWLFASAGMRKGSETSVYTILGAVIIKLLFCMGFVLVYLLKFRVNSINFLLQFFSLYLLFTVFEVYCLLRNLRDQIKT